jgi:hypothetical protein
MISSPLETVLGEMRREIHMIERIDIARVAAKPIRARDETHGTTF